jgi:CRP-like cAMP-binding protein
MSMHTPQPARNAVLAALAAADYQLIQPHLQYVDLPLRTPLEHRMKHVEYIYFMESGIASVVADGDRPIEVGVIGREGMTGVSVILGKGGEVPYETYIQIEGSGQRIATDRLRAAIAKSPALHNVLLGYVHSFLAQATQTALANGRGTLEQRLARWLLMIDDRVDGNTVPMTHEFLGVMLGVQRSGVTVTLREIERQGAISQKRGAIDIIDRGTLEDIAKANYVRLIPSLATLLDVDQAR